MVSRHHPATALQVRVIVRPACLLAYLLTCLLALSFALLGARVRVDGPIDGGVHRTYAVID
jgi:hypothetical protein